jgi:pilin isopeptide linkage protein
MRKIRSLLCLIAVCLLSCFVFTSLEISALAYATLEAEIPVTCLEIRDGKTHIYQIAIEAENNTSPNPKSGILEITENRTGKFEIDIDEPGTFVYKVYEKEGSEPNIKYDKNIYSVTVFVEEVSDHTLKYAVTAKIEGKNEKPDAIAFENIVEGEKEIVTTSPADAVTTETAVRSIHTNPPPDRSKDAPGRTPEKVTAAVTTTTAVTASENDHTGNPVTEWIDNVLTGDNFPAHAIRMLMLSSILIAIATLLFKRDNNEEEEKNEE